MIILCTTNPMTEEKQRENKDISRMAITHDMYLPESSTLDPMANHHVPSQNFYTWDKLPNFQTLLLKPSIVSVLAGHIMQIKLFNRAISKPQHPN